MCLQGICPNLPKASYILFLASCFPSSLSLLEIKINFKCSPPSPIVWFPRSNHKYLSPFSLLLRLNVLSLLVSFYCLLLSSFWAALLERKWREALVALEETGEHMGQGFFQLSSVVYCSRVPILDRGASLQCSLNFKGYSLWEINLENIYWRI